jgi:cell division protein FtsI/penicillin-binding protein 2
MRIKDQWNEQRIFASRTFAAILIIGLLSLSLLGKLIVLQIIRHDYYLELSQGNRVRQDPIPASRGQRAGLPAGADSGADSGS